MSMLAERKRKVRYVINPEKKPLWTADYGGIKFGKELMEKMGWSAGKGLGANEQGIQEPLRVSYKNDSKGMGYKGNEESWIKHQEEFNFLLNELAGNTDNNVETKEAEKSEVMSLEKKSKLSKARVHYNKFIRGKDLSRYSENDLSCILGSGKMKKANGEATAEKPTPSDINAFETSFGVTTINSGSITDYFKKKWTLNSLKSENSNADQSDKVSDSGSNLEQQFSEETNGILESKSKKRKRESREASLNNGSGSEGNENEEKEIKKHKKKRKELEIGTEKKKKRKSKENNMEMQFEEVREKSKKKKKKKEKEAEYKDDQLEADTLESKDKMSKKKKDKTKSGSHSDTPKALPEAECEMSNSKEEKEDKSQRETVIHSHKAALFQMKPLGFKKNLTAKGLKLIYGAKIEDFKGSNLGNIVGYGYKK